MRRDDNKTNLPTDGLNNSELINGRYKLIGQIGIGGSSSVYLVRDCRIGKNWAMKKIHKRDGLSVILASRELDILKSIDYPLFPKIIDAWQDKEGLYIISDYIEGISLDKVNADMIISRKQLYKWSLSILDALNYLHGLSPPILYLDLKPENIILRVDGKISLIDFGIAGRITTNALPFGTVGYAAPEQYLKNRDTIDEQTDIYAFGMTYYSLRCGIIPDKNPNVNFENVINSKVLSHKEKSFLKKCIAVDKQYRFKNIDKTIESFKQIETFHFKFKKINLVAWLILMIGIGAFFYQRVRANSLREDAARRMVTEADKYIEDGNYTKEGLKIITTFINSGCLDDETEQEFIFEAAKNYFEIQSEYVYAERYFRKLNQEKFPEAKYYIELCKLEQSFDFDEEKVGNCLGRFYKSQQGMAPSLQRFNNIFFIGNCYEKYSLDEIEGIRKSLTVLEGEYEYMKDLKLDSLDEEESLNIEKCRKKYEGKIALLYEKAKRKEKINERK